MKKAYVGPQISMREFSPENIIAASGDVPEFANSLAVNAAKEAVGAGKTVYVFDFMD